MRLSALFRGDASAAIPAPEFPKQPQYPADEDRCESTLRNQVSPTGPSLRCGRLRDHPGLHQVASITWDGSALTADQIVEAVRAEFRPGGRPVAKYGELHAARDLDQLRGSALTTQMVANLEERIVRIERALKWEIPA